MLYSIIKLAPNWNRDAAKNLQLRKTKDAEKEWYNEVRTNNVNNNCEGYCKLKKSISGNKKQFQKCPADNIKG